ncbi:MAG: hypothetical protein KKC80_00280, partial [Candidatus Margulisbacteria bacterium]|nr:hypothetical protein [Candidatus Margulisiibacteriota bacterium]
MKKGWLIIFFVFLVVGSAFSLDISGDKENISLKAGPTEPGEGLSLVWVEAIIYPKTVKDDKIIS